VDGRDKPGHDRGKVVRYGQSANQIANVIGDRNEENMSGQFDGKVAFVTGAASGIGQEVALAFAAASARVVVADIAETGGQETVAATSGTPPTRALP
jgi:3-oxoacyl-ACP reductase-like protein